MCLKKTKLNINLTCNQAIPLLGNYPRQVKTYVHTKTCTQKFTTGSFIRAQNMKQRKCPSTAELINKL